MFKDENGIWNIAGIASAGTDCRIIDMAINMNDGILSSNLFPKKFNIYFNYIQLAVHLNE